MKKFTLLFVLFLLSTSVFAMDLSILSWNTFLIPPPFNITKQDERADLMAKKLLAINHDIIFFQEAFLDSKREHIINDLKPEYPYSAAPEKGTGLIQFQDSGLFIVSKYPMKVLEQVIFEDCSGSDCFASKSAIIVEISLPDNNKLQMIDTHLQGWDEVNIRQKQLLQIKMMMKRNAQFGIAQVLVGDLNIDGKKDIEYQESLKLMDMTSIPLVGQLDSSNGFSTRGCFDTPGGESEGEWLDHVWLNSNHTQTEVYSKKVVPILGNLGHLECPLSDHYALEAYIKVNKNLLMNISKGIDHKMHKKS